MKQSKEEVFERFAGANGVKDQLAVFSDLWVIATAYVRTVRQSAVGGLSAIESTAAGHNELLSVAQASNDILGWFERCQEELIQLQKRSEAAEVSVDSTEPQEALQRNIH